MNHLIYSFILLALAAVFKTLLCSMRETDLVGISRLQQKYPRIIKHAESYEKRWDMLLASISLLVAICQIASIAAILVGYASGALSPLVTLAAVGVVTALTIFFLEMVPEVAASAFSDRLTATFLPLGMFISYALSPVLAPLVALNRAVEKYLFARADAQDRPTAEEEILSLMEQAQAGDIDLHEKEFIRSVFDFDETDVHEIMTPRVDVEAVEDTEKIGECAARIRDIPHSRYPVYHENLDDVRGILHVKDMMRKLSLEHDEDSVMTVCKEACFVPETMKIAKLFDMFKTRRAHLAVVVDEYGGTAGIVALEDVIEELVGDIRDESDRDDPELIELADGSFLLQAREPVDEVNEILGIAIPTSEQYDSVGGFIFHRMSRIPQVGESVAGEGFRIIVQKASDRQIQSVRIYKGSRDNGATAE